MADFLIKSYFPKRRLVGFFSLLFPTSILIYYVKPALKITGTQDGAIDTGPRHREIFPLQKSCVITLTVFYSFGFVKEFQIFSAVFLIWISFLLLFLSEVYFLYFQCQQKHY